MPAAVRDDAKRVHALIRRAAPSLRPFAMGRSVGYGRFRYRYATGREGETALVSLAPRATGLSLYVNAVKRGRYLAEAYAPRLGKVSCGRSCIRFRRAEDLDEGVLAALVRDAQRAGGAARA
jgi:hypothetical protein